MYILKNLSRRIILVFLAVIIPLAVFPQRKQYEKVMTYPSITSCKDFIRKYPKSEFLPEVREKLEGLEFRAAVRGNTPEAFSSFLNDYPYSRFKDWASIKRDSLQVIVNWKAACSADTPEAYSSFIDGNRGASEALKSQALIRFRKRTVTGEWESVKKSNDFASLKQFLDKYECIRTVPEYDSCYQLLSDLIWKEAIIGNTLDSFISFYNSWPGSVHIREAAEKLETYDNGPLLAEVRNDISENQKNNSSNHYMALIPYISTDTAMPHFIIKNDDRTYASVKILSDGKGMVAHDNRFYTSLPFIAFMKPKEAMVVVVPFDTLLNQKRFGEMVNDAWVSGAKVLGISPHKLTLRINTAVYDRTCFVYDSTVTLSKVFLWSKYDCKYIERCLSEGSSVSVEEKVRALRTVEFSPSAVFDTHIRKLLNDTDRRIMYAAIAAYCSIHPDDTEVLLKLFNAGSEEKLLALDLISKYRMPGYQVYLKGIIQNAGDTLRKNVVRSLLRVNNESTRALLKDSYQSVKAEIIESLYNELTSDGASGMLLALGETAIPDYYLKMREDSKDEVITELLISNGRKSTPYLMALLSEPGINKGDIIGIIGEVKDTIATKSIMPFLASDDELIRRRTVSALTRMKDARCLEGILLLAENETSHYVLKNILDLQSEYIKSRLIEKDENAVSTLKVLLKNWDLSGEAYTLLLYHGWKPVSFEDSVYTSLSRRSRGFIYTKQDEANAVLMKDIESSKRYVVENAIYSLISMGQRSILPQLYNILMARGTKVLAEVYLNSGSEDLERYAKTWASNHGYSINSGVGTYKATWGSIR